ncbi:MAG: MutS family DNA mismatch repair protein [Myxococcota bacterium]|nr:MutS family DNA mismatch repair protein [Myxococcota bacterium]
MDARASYERGAEVCRREVARLDAQARKIAMARLILAASGVALVGAIVWVPLGSGGRGVVWAALGVATLGFLVLVVLHARVHEAGERAAAGLRFHERGLARLAHDWDRLPATSARFRTADHPYTADLDIFGRASLMQLADTTETRMGEERLAGLLSLVSPQDWPVEVRRRQAAARDLAPRLPFREALAIAGGVLAGDKPDAAPLLAWAESKQALPPILRVAAWALPLSVGAVVVLAPLLGWPAMVTTVAVVGGLALGMSFSAKVTPSLQTVSARESTATRWRTSLAAIEREAFEAPLLVETRTLLCGGARRASDEMAALQRVIGFVDARNNEVFRFLIGPLLMWDVHCAFALQRWRARAGDDVRRWLDALGEVEALAGVASFAFDHPDFAWPDLALEPLFDARALGHPLLPSDRRVGNDVHLSGPGMALVVTGSNMSGKSTLLRAMGVSAVLANAGAPVCARSLRIGPLSVATSMRVEDSLEQGVSHFYAELRRLKRVLDWADDPRRATVFFLLDEILHGTNSRERVIGACAVVRQLVAHRALGAVSTHDLGITALEQELGARVQNVHLQEQVADDAMTFDYVLRPGIVQSSNALRLMKALGIDVVSEP